MPDQPEGLVLAGLTADVLRISDLYAAEHGIDRSGDWALLKLQEELGELTAEHLRLSGRARGTPDPAALGNRFGDAGWSSPPPGSRKRNGPQSCFRTAMRSRSKVTRGGAVR